MKDLSNQAFIFIGNDKLDAEHAKIINMLADMENSQMTQQKRIAMCGELLTYVKTHFVEEEAFMRSYNFPGSDSHSISHKNLRQNFISKLTKFLQNDSSVAKDLKRSFYTHVLLHDISMITYIKNR